MQIQRSTFDPAKLVGPYPVLGAFLLVMESLLGFWFFRAEDSTERIVAGVLMVLVFGGFLYTVIRISAQKQNEGTVSPHGLGTVTPASEEITPSQIETLETEKIVSPDRSYTLNSPPNDWIVQELTETEWYAENLAVSDPNSKQRFAELLKLNESSITLSQAPEILLIKTKDINLLTPIPGKTTIDGVKVPTALETPLPTRLSIIPIYRAQPPFFIERPFVHNFYKMVSMLFNVNVLTLQKIWSGTIASTKRQQIVAEFRQVVQDCLLNGNETKEVSGNTLFIGIEGDIRDYILMVNYTTSSVRNDEKVNKDLQTIQSLISSFCPVKVINPEKQLQEFKVRAESNFEKLLTEKGEEMFFTEFVLLMYRINGSDLDNPENRLRVMRQLKPFEILSAQAHIESELLDSLWSALQKAEKGDAEDFKQILTKCVETIMKTDEKSEESSNNDSSLPSPANEEQENSVEE